MKKTILIAAVALLTAVGAQAQSFFHKGVLSDVKYGARLGYNLGGSAPLNMPASIRKMNKFPLTPNIAFGINAEKPLDGDFGLMVGVRFENKGMSVDASVKNYKMEMVKGGERLGGVFTGKVVTKTTQWMFTFPVQATFHYKKVTFKAGPYVSYLTGREFYGWAYDGYIRVDDPTGPKVMLGSTPDERGDYDFTPDMRRWQVGVDVGVDWAFGRRFGAYADLSCGFHGIHRSGFKIIEQTLVPIYGSIGVTYAFY